MLIALAAFMSFFGIEPVRADSALSVSETSVQQQIGPRNVWVRPFFGARNTVLYKFDVQSANGTSKANEVKLRVPTTARMPEAVYVYDGGAQLASALPDQTNRTATLNGFTLDIPQASPKTLTILADFPRTDYVGTYGEYAQVELVSVGYATSSNVSAVATPSSKMVSVPQRLFRPMSANIGSFEAPTIIEERNSSGVLTSIYGLFVVTFTPEGGSLRSPRADDFVILGNVGGDEVPCQVTMYGSVSEIQNGSTYYAYVGGRIPLRIEGASHQRAGAVSFRIAQVTWENHPNSPAISTQQTWGLESLKTATTAFLPKADPETLATTGRVGKVSTKVWDEITSALQPVDGFKGQVVSEGGQILICPTNPNTKKYLVFPTSSPLGGQIAEVDVVVTPSTMTPSVRAPEDLSVDSRETLVEYPLSSLVRIPTSQQTMFANFEVNLGGLHVQGKAIRTGPLTAILQFYWDCESGIPNAPGANLDRLDVAPAYTAGNVESRPMRFNLGIGQVSKDSSSFRLNVKGAPGAFSVYTSRDLASWSAVDFEYGPMQSDALGGLTMTGELRIPSASLTTPEAPTRFFRLEVR